MPKPPDSVIKRMNDRLNYKDEEYVARRVLRAAGYPGKPFELMNEVTFDGDDPTFYDLAIKLIQHALRDVDLGILQHSADNIADARAFFDNNPYRGKRRHMLILCRIADNDLALFGIDKEWLLNLMKPPYSVVKELDDGMVLIEQRIEPLAASLGVKDVAQDILSGRLSI